MPCLADSGGAASAWNMTRLACLEHQIICQTLQAACARLLCLLHRLAVADKLQELCQAPASPAGSNASGSELVGIRMRDLLCERYSDDSLMSNATIEWTACARSRTDRVRQHRVMAAFARPRRQDTCVCTMADASTPLSPGPAPFRQRSFGQAAACTTVCTWPCKLRIASLSRSPESHATGMRVHHIHHGHYLLRVVQCDAASCEEQAPSLGLACPDSCSFTLTAVRGPRRALHC